MRFGVVWREWPFSIRQAAPSEPWSRPAHDQSLVSSERSLTGFLNPCLSSHTFSLHMLRLHLGLIHLNLVFQTHPRSRVKREATPSVQGSTSAPVPCCSHMVFSSLEWETSVSSNEWQLYCNAWICVETGRVSRSLSPSDTGSLSPSERYTGIHT